MDSYNNNYPYRKENLHLFYKLRKALPHNIYFYYSFYTIKYLPLYIMSHNISNFEPNSLFTINHNLLALSFFGYGYIKYQKIYTYTIFFTIIILCFFIILGLFVRYQISSKIKSNRYLAIKKNKKKGMKKIPFLVFVILFILIAFFSQHVVEFNLLGILNFCHKDLKLLPQVMGTTQAIILILNIINIILVLFITQIFLIITSDFSFRHSLKEYKNIIFHNKINFAIIVGSSYGLVSIFSWENGTKDKEQLVHDYHYYLGIVVAIFLIVQIWGLVTTFNFYNQNLVNKIRLFFSYLCFISSIDELILHYFNTMQLTQGYSLCKLILEIVNAFIFTSVNINLISSSHVHNLSKIFFQKKHSVNTNEILSYIELVYDYQKGKITFDQIFSVFSQHKIDCKEIDCACKTMDISKVVGKDGNIDKELASEYFSVVGLYEIKKSIHYFYQNNTKKNYLQIFILLHTEHMFTIKKDYNLTLYIISQYLSHKIAEKFDFLTIFYLYEYRYKTYHKITKLKRKKANFKETAREKLKLRQNIIFRHHFVEYTKILEKINELLDNCCQNLKKILHFRQKAIIRSHQSHDIYTQCENFISLCKELELKHELLSKNISSFSGKIKHYELSYLITYYYLLIFKKVPKKIQHKICYIDVNQKFDIESYKKNRAHSYSNFKMENPMIVFLDINDDFIIRYVANNLSINLNFTTKELLNRPISELIPSNIQEFHKVLMKKYVLFSNEKFQKHTFILDKEKYLQEAKISALPIPTIENNIGIIFCFELINLQKDDDLSSEKKGDSPKYDIRKLTLAQTNSIRKQKKKIEYNIIIDKDYNFTCINKNFSKEFFFNLEKLNVLKMDFCSFFGIYPERLRNAFRNLTRKQHKSLTAISLTDKGVVNAHSNDIFELIKDDKRHYKIFALGEQNLMFKNINKESPKDIKLQKYRVNTILPKHLIVKNIPNIIKTINEIGLDIEWFTRANCFRERLVLNGTSPNFITNYTFVPLERMSYIIVNLTEKVNPTVHQTKMDGFNTSILNVNAFTNSGNESSNNNIIINSKIFKGTNILSPTIFKQKLGGTILTPAIIPETPGEETVLNDVNILTNKYRGSVNFGSNSSKFDGVQIIKKKSKKEKSFRKKISLHPIEETNTLNIMYNTMSDGFADKSTNSFGVDNSNSVSQTELGNESMNMFVKSSHLNSGVLSSINKSNPYINEISSDKSSTSIIFINSNNSIVNSNNNFLLNTNCNSSFNSSGQLLIKPNQIHNNSENTQTTIDSFAYAPSIHIKTGNFFKFQNISKYFGMLSYFLFCVLIFLSIFTFLFNRNLMNLSRSLFDINIYSLLIKSDIFFGALGVLTSCENSYQNMNDDLLKNVAKMGLRGEELISDYSDLMKKLHDISNNKLHQIFDILNIKNIYYNLQSQFTIIEKESTFHEELLLFHYILIHIYQQKIPFQQCRLPSLFENTSIYLPNNSFYEKDNITPSFEEEAVYYIVKNVLTIFKANLEQLTRTTNSVFINYIKESKEKIVIYNTSICFVALILLIIMIVLVYNHKNDLQILVSIIYTDRESDVSINKGLSMIIGLLTNFNKDRCGDFEKNKNVFKQVDNVHNSSITKVQQQQNLNDKNDKILKQQKSKRNKKYDLNFNQKNSIHSNLNNHSSHIKNDNHKSNNNINHIFHNSFNKKQSILHLSIQEKNPFANATGISQDKRTLYLNKDNAEILISLYPNTLTIPTIVRWSIYIIIIAISIFIIIEIVNLIVVYQQYDDLYLMNLISINLIDRLQKLCELEIYAKISILLNDPFYLTTEQSQYNKLSYSNYYNISFDISNNYVFNTLGNSEFSFLYYQSLQITENINKYINSKQSEHLLEVTLRLQKLLEQDEGVCIYGAVGFTIHNKTNVDSLTLEDEFIEISDTVSNCKKIGNGITINPLNSLIELLLNEMVNMYCDFVQMEPKERNPESFLNMEIVKISNLVITEPLNKLQNTFVLTELHDMERVYNWNGKIGIVFSIILFVDLVISMFIVDGYLIRDVEKKIEALSFTQKILA